MRRLTSLLKSSSLLSTSTVCPGCAQRLQARAVAPSYRVLSTSRPAYQSAASTLSSKYFFANDRSVPSAGDQRQLKHVEDETSGVRIRTSARKEQDASTEGKHNSEAEITSSPRPRRRDRLKTITPTALATDGSFKPLPLDASSTLSSLATSAPPSSLKRTLLAYLSLTKPRLATLIVLTTTASYSLYPVPSLLSTVATQTPSLSTLTLFFLTTGTFSVVASANTLNMLFEPAYDAQMSRTRNRPLVRGLISTRGAYIFALATALLGTGILWYGVNPTTSILGASNIVLYAFAYTRLKRISIVNTWVGAVVGAIPPLMGWCAAGGHYLLSPDVANSTSNVQGLIEEARALLFSEQAIGGWLLASLLFAWQFPHFNALSHPIRHEYANAGYKMMVSTRPALNARVALRYSLAMFPVCAGLTYVGVTDRGFLVTSSIANGWMAKEAWAFWKSGGGETGLAQRTARGLFWASVWHLPLVLVLAMVHKRGLWDSVWRGLVGDDGAMDDLEDDEID